MTDDPAFPRIARPDAALIVIGFTHTESVERQRSLADGQFAPIDRERWVEGLVAVTWFRKRGRPVTGPDVHATPNPHKDPA